MIYWLAGVLLALLVGALYLNAWLERQECRRDYRAEWEALQRCHERDRQRSRLRSISHYGQLARELRSVGATEAAAKVEAKRREIVLSIAEEFDELQRRTA